MRNSENGSRMMLTELMFSILFFMVIVAVCIQLFAGAVMDARRSRELAMAVNLVSGEADRFIAGGRMTTPLSYNADGELIEEGESADEVAAGEPGTGEVSGDTPAYKLVSEKLHTTGKLQSTTFSFIDLSDGSTVYSLDISRRLR